MDYLEPGTVDSVDVKTMGIVFTVSTPIIDRADDVIEIGALALKSHERLPYLCMAHERLHPVGLCQEPESKEYLLKWEKTGLMGKGYFTQDNWDSEWIFDKVVKGLLNGVSPGFIPKSFRLNPESKRGGRIYTTATKEHLVNDLLEVSVCVNGENPEAYVHIVEKCLKEEKKPSEWVQKAFEQQYKNTSLTLSTTINPVNKEIVVEKQKVANQPDGGTVDADKKKAMPPGASCCKALHEHYVKHKALVVKHKALQEKDSPVHAHLEEQEKAVDALRTDNKAFHDERYGADHGELDDVEGDAEEVGKELSELITIKKEFNLFQARTNKQIKDLVAENKELKKKTAGVK